MEGQEQDCLICRQTVPESHIILETAYWRVRHSMETRILGYCILESRRHFLDLSEANPAELSEYGPLLAQIMKVQRALLDCERIYTFSLAEAVPHFHLHVIPRDRDFPRFYRARGIMSFPLVPVAKEDAVKSISGLFAGRLRRCLAKQQFKLHN